MTPGAKKRAAKPPEVLADEFRTIDQAAVMLGCGRSKVYTLAHQGRLELVKFDHFTRVTTASLLRLLNEIKNKPAQFRKGRL
jgi:excisionase family DNA binding protein